MHSFDQLSEIPSPASYNFSYEEAIVDNKKGFRCLFPDCEKTFRFKSDMKRHILIHTKDRPYTCEYPSCRRNFKRPDALRIHMQTHDQNCSYFCTEPGCEAQFSKLNALQYHQLKHNNKRFVCNYKGCQKAFYTSQHLKQHQNAEYHQKFTRSPSQNSNQNPPNDIPYFFEPFEDPAPESETNMAPLITESSLNEDLDPKPEKLLHTEEGAAAIEIKFENTISNHVEKFPEINLPGSQEPSKLDFGDFFQLMICKYLLQENRKMRTRLGIQTDSIKGKFENRLLARLNKSLKFHQFDLKDIS